MMIQENLPNDWEYLPIRSIFTESDTRCGDNQYDLLSVTQDRGIIKQSDVDIKKDISNDDKSKYKVVLKDSIAYNKMRMWQGAVGINEIDDGIVSPAYVVINPTKEMNTKFYYYLFKTPYMISQFGKYSYGLVDDMNSLRYDDFQKIYIPIPPIEEQNKIVNFIDKKSTNIEKFIQDKTRFIELLKEQKEALINEAVTKGEIRKNHQLLDDFRIGTKGDVQSTADGDQKEFKDSEIEWLGEIPKHWEASKLKYISKIIYGISPNEKTYNTEGQGTILVNGPAEYSDSDFGYTKAIKWTIEPVKFAKKGDLLICLRGSTTGRLNICHEDLCIGRGCASLRASTNHKFFIFLMMITRKQIESSFKGSTFPSITSEVLDNFKVPLPPTKEQLQIAEYIENELSQIDKLIEKTTKEIELIKEYKTSLINEAVSGKIKVC
jgi:type I restriction enzyme S subunit